MAHTLEELATQLTSDADFVKLSQAEQDQVFATLAKDIDQPHHPTQEFPATISAVIPPTVGSVLPASTGLQRIAGQHPFLANLPWMRAGAAGLDAMRNVGAAINTPLETARTAAEGGGFHPIQAYQRELRGGRIEPTIEQQRMKDLTNIGISMIPLGVPPLPQAIQRAIVPMREAVESARLPQMTRPRPLEFLKGNPNRIAEADKALEDAAHALVKKVRIGGELHGKVGEMLSRESDLAWAPMKAVTSSIPGTIGINEVRSTATSLLANEPERLAAVNLFLDNMALTPEYTLPKSGRAFQFTASDWADLSSELGGFVRKAALRGKAARSLTDQINTDIRNSIANILESKAPQDLQGNVALAKRQWADYATDRDRLFQLFAPGGSPRLPTKAGAGFLKKASLGQLSKDEQEFLDRVNAASQLNLPESIKPFAKALLKVQKSGRIGKTIARRLPWVGVGGAGLLTEEYLRRH